MNIVEILLLAVSLAMDALAVSVSVSLFLKKPTDRQKFRIFFHFGLFQFLFPIAGYYLIIWWNINTGNFGKLCAGAILIILGLKMFYEALENKKEELEDRKDITKGMSLILFSSGVSIDALSVGVSMGLIKAGIWVIAIAAGVITSLLSYLGISYGSYLGEKAGKYTEFLGGLILILLGLKVGLA